MIGHHLTNYLDVVRVVNRLQVASLRSYGFPPNTGKRFLFLKHPYQLWGTPSFLFISYWGCFLMGKVA
jgi:hypothetical protein